MTNIISSRKPSTLILSAIIFSAAVVLAYTFFYVVGRPSVEKRMVLHLQIIAGSAPSPYQYRVLVPTLAEIIIRAADLILPARYAFRLAYVIIDLAGISFLLFSLYLFLTIWFDWRYVLIGCLFVATVIPLTYHEDLYFQPWSFWEAGFFNLALVLIYKRRHAWLACLVLAATLNRETALLICLAFLLISQDIGAWVKGRFHLERRELAVFTGLCMIWLAVFLCLRVLRPPAEHIETLVQILRNNIQPVHLAKAALNMLLFLGVFWFLAIAGWKKSALLIRRAALVIPCYALLLIVWAYWREVRVLMPFYSILIALGIAALPGAEKEPYT